MDQKIVECHNQIQEGLGYLMLRAKYANDELKQYNDELKQYEALKKGLEELLTHYMDIPALNEQFYHDAGLRKGWGAALMGWGAALDEIKKLLEGTTMADVNPKEDRRFETVSKEGNATIMRVASDKPQPKCYGHYKKIDPCDDNDNVGKVLEALEDAIKGISNLHDDGLARKVESFTLVIKDETIGWKADIWEGEGK